MLTKDRLRLIGRRLVQVAPVIVLATFVVFGLQQFSHDELLGHFALWPLGRHYLQGVGSSCSLLARSGRCQFQSGNGAPTELLTFSLNRHF